MASVITEAAQALFDARQGKVPKPLLSMSVDNLDEEIAYQIQQHYVNLIRRDDEIAGFKAALTNPVAQQMFGAKTPASGILFASGHYLEGAELSLNHFVMPVLETEIGYRVGEKISRVDERLSVQSLQNRIEAVLPMVEVADIGFMERLSTAPDLISANSGSAAYIVGEPSGATDNLNEIDVSFFRDGEKIGAGTGGDAMGDQWQAALWLVNQVLAQGYEINPGNYLMTGSLGRIYPAQPGHFVADYGEFGRVSFSFD